MSVVTYNFFSEEDALDEATAAAAVGVVAVGVVAVVGAAAVRAVGFCEFAPSEG